MRILYHHRIASRDGQAVHVEEIVHALRAAGHDVLLVGPQWIETETLGFEGGLVSHLKRLVPRQVYELLELSYNLIVAVRLLLAVRKFRPDVIYERYNLYMVAGVYVKRMVGVPLLLEVNAPLYLERRRYGGIGLPALARWTERTAWRRADLILSVTAVLGRIVCDEGVDPARVVVIPNGINPERFAAVPDSAAAKSRLGLDGRIVLGFTGFMREWHGLERLVDVAAGADDRILLIVGDGPARSLVERRATELGISDRVRITGVVPRDEIASYVRSFDVALQPEVVDYASPLKLFEYLALGRAIVAPDKPNIREVLQHERNALLFRPGDVRAMEAAIERLCADGDLRARLAEEARETIQRRGLTWHANAAAIVRLASGLRDA